MPMLQFLPWCHIDKEYVAGDVMLIPFRRDEPIPEVGALVTSHARTILRSYKNFSGFPVRNAAVVKFQDKELLDDLSNEEQFESYASVDLATLSGLANRQHFHDWENYCNADCFTMIIQQFRDSPVRGAIISRRLIGQSINSIALAELVCSMPTHVSTQEFKLDDNLLTGLTEYRKSANATKQSRWQNAIACFNRANTDSPSNLFQIEWVLSCSAFQKALDADSNAQHVAELFTKRIQCEKEIKATESRRNPGSWKDNGQPIRYEWMREFYRVRGDFAHGKLKTNQPLSWKPEEHIVLAAIGFPLLIRCLLQEAGHYTLSPADKCQLNAFESLIDGDIFAQVDANDPFAKPLWRRLLEQEQKEARVKSIQSRLESASDEKKRREN